MQIKRKSQRFYQIILILLTAFVVTIVSINVIKTATTVVAGIMLDFYESEIYLVHKVKGLQGIRSEVDLERNENTELKSGSYIRKINGKPINSIDDYQSFVNDSNQILVLSVFDIEQYREVEFTTDKKSLHNNSVIFLSNLVTVSNVEDESPAMRAGIQRGDILHSINGVLASRDLKAIKYLRDQKSGKILTYTMIRDGSFIDFELEIAEIGIKFTYLLQILVAYFFIIFGAFISIKRAGLIAARLIGLVFLCFGYLLGSNILDPPHLNFYSGLIYFLTTLSLAMVLPLVFHSVHYFPEEKLKLNKRRIFIYVPYIIAGIVVLLIYFGFLLNFEKYSGILLGASIVLNILYFIMYSIIYRKRVEQRIKKIERPILIAYFVNLAGFAISNIMTLTRIELVPHQLWFLFEFGFIGLIFIPLAYLYTIGRYRLLDLEIRVRKNIQFTMISVLWHLIIIAAYCVSVYYLTKIDFILPNIHFTGTTIEVLDRPIQPELREIYEKIAVVILSLALTLLFYKILTNSKNYLDKIFFRVHFDFRKASTELSDVLEQNLSLNDISRSLCVKIASLIGFKQFGIIFFREGRVITQSFSGVSDNYLSEFIELIGQELSASVSEFTGAVRIDYLPQRIKTVLTDFRFKMLFPIKSKGKIIGIFLVGEKLSEASIHREDIDFITSVSSQTAVAIENALLYQDLAKQERLRQELEIARRIQLASLPASIPLIEGLDISGISLPALEVGGDFYDYLNGTEKEITIIVGDVSGKGTSAALYMSKAQGIMRTLNEFAHRPYDLFLKTNDLLYKYLEKSSFITAIGAQIDTVNHRLRFARAGHLPLYYFNSKNKTIDKVTPKGLVLGLTGREMFSRNLEEVSIEYSDGDIFLFFTDGIIEARNGHNEEFGFERLSDVLMQSTVYDSDTIKQRIIDSVRNFSLNRDQFDDMTLVVVKATNNHHL